jgi:hypothetical protein
MNRQSRRKIVNKIATEVIKGKESATVHKQWDFGFILTNRMLCITFWRWVWTPWDRRITKQSKQQNPLKG